MSSIRDARQAARTFLTGHAPLLDGAAREALERAAALYAEELETFAPPDSSNIFLILSEGKTIADWTPEIRERTRQMLIEAWNLENQAIAELEKAIV